MLAVDESAARCLRSRALHFNRVPSQVPRKAATRSWSCICSCEIQPRTASHRVCRVARFKRSQKLVNVVFFVMKKNTLTKSKCALTSGLADLFYLTLNVERSFFGQRQCGALCIDKRVARYKTKFEARKLCLSKTVCNKLVFNTALAETKTIFIDHMRYCRRWVSFFWCTHNVTCGHGAVAYVMLVLRAPLAKDFAELAWSNNQSTFQVFKRLDGFGASVSESVSPANCSFSGLSSMYNLSVGRNPYSLR